MSQIDYTTTALIASIKRKASIPENQNLFNAEDFVQILNGELRNYIVPILLRVREEYFVTYSDQSIVAGTTSYEIPNQAIGKKLRAVYMVDDSGELVELPRLNPEDVAIDRQVYRPYGYYVQGDNIILYPSPTSSGTLRMFFHRRPNQLVETDYAAKISSVSGSVVTCESIPTAWTTNSYLDCIDKNPSFKVLAESVQPTVISGYDITLPLATAALLETGDWISEEGESPIPQVPVEMFDLLEQAAIVKCLEAMGDQTGGFQAAVMKMQQLEANIIDMISPRVDGNPKKVTNKRGLWSASKIRYWNV
jgi:hypothetical protein